MSFDKQKLNFVHVCIGLNFVTSKLLQVSIFLTKINILTRTASPREPAVKAARGMLSLLTVIHLVIQPRRRMRKKRKVPTLRRAFTLYLPESLLSPQMMKSCLE